jgi:hypothetical protein
MIGENAASHTPSVDSSHEHAIRYTKDCDWPNALFYSRVLHTHNPTPESLFLLSQALFRSLDYASCYNMLLLVQVHTPETVILLAKSAIKLGIFSRLILLQGMI